MVHVFTELAHRPIQSTNCDVRVSPLRNPGWTRELWLNSLLLILSVRMTNFVPEYLISQTFSKQGKH